MRKNLTNGFKRNFINPHLKLIRQIEFQDFSFLAWKPDEDIWLKSRKRHFILLNIDSSLQKSKELKLEIPREFDAERRNYYYSNIDSIVYVTNEAGEIVKLSKVKSSFFKMPNIKFDDPSAISHNSIVVRIFLKHKQKTILAIAKIAINNKAEIQKKYILPDQTEGIFSSDGILQYDKVNSKIYYAFYRKGEFLCLDTNLNLLYKAKTIDTVRFAKLKIGIYKDKSKGKTVDKRTLQNSFDKVNGYFTTNNDKLYIHSLLKADNQSISDFSNNSAIDVYSLKDGEYLYSFLIPKYMGSKIGKFSISGTVILAMYRHSIVKYMFSQ